MSDLDNLTDVLQDKPNLICHSFRGERDIVWVHIRQDNNSVTLDGEFTRDELRALLEYMTCPDSSSD